MLLLLILLLYYCYQSLSSVAPAHIADDINLVADSGERLLRSEVDRTCVVPRIYTDNISDDKSFVLPVHCCAGTIYRYRLMTGHQLRTFPMANENISIWDYLTTRIVSVCLTVP